MAVVNAIIQGRVVLQFKGIKSKKKKSESKKASINRIKGVTLTSLCLYSIRQATIWVDMIAEDLFAAVRQK